MTEFNLDSWEVGSRCREATKGVVGGEVSGKIYRAVEMRRKKWGVFVRESRGLQTGNWIVISSEGNSPHVWSNDPTFSHSVSIATGLGRFFVWGEESVFLFANGNGFWLDEQLKPEVPFSNVASPDMVERSSHETFLHLTHELERESDFAYARRWKDLDDETKLAALYGSSLQLEEFRSLMRSVLVLDIDKQLQPRKWSWRLYGNEAHENLFLEEGSRHYRPSEFLQDWEELILETMSTQVQIPIRAHACIAEFVRREESGIEVDISPPPTQHELLEARLLLRDWLELNAPDCMGLLEETKR